MQGTGRGRKSQAGWPEGNGRQLIPIDMMKSAASTLNPSKQRGRTEKSRTNGEGPMEKSKRLRLRDLKDAYRLIGECRDLGGEVQAWRKHMLLGLRRLVDAQVAMAAEVRGDGPSWSAALHEPVDVGWESDEARAVLLQFEEETGPPDDNTFHPLLGQARPLLTRIREQVMEDREWYMSAIFNE